MGKHRLLTLLKGRVRRDPIELGCHGASQGSALDLGSQHEGCFALRQFSGGDRFGATPTREDGLPRYPQIAHPIHDPIRGGEIALPLLLLEARSGRYEADRLCVHAP